MKTWLRFKTDDPMTLEKVLSLLSGFGKLKRFDYETGALRGDPTDRGVELESEDLANEALQAVRKTFPDLQTRVSER